MDQGGRKRRLRWCVEVRTVSYSLLGFYMVSRVADPSTDPEAEKYARFLIPSSRPPPRAGWHQDAAYWGLDPPDSVNAWAPAIWGQKMGSEGSRLAESDGVFGSNS